MDGDIGIILTSVLETGERVLLQLEILKPRTTVSSDIPGSTVLSPGKHRQTYNIQHDVEERGDLQ